MLDMLDFLPAFLVPFSSNNKFPIKKIGLKPSVSQIISDFLN